MALISGNRKEEGRPAFGHFEVDLLVGRPVPYTCMALRCRVSIPIAHGVPFVKLERHFPRIVLAGAPRLMVALQDFLKDSV